MGSRQAKWSHCSPLPSNEEMLSHSEIQVYQQGKWTPLAQARNCGFPRYLWQWDARHWLDLEGKLACN